MSALCRKYAGDRANEWRRSTNDVLALEIAGAGTQYSAQNAGTGSQAAFETLLNGDLWMIYRNVLTNVLHWDFVSLDCTSYGPWH